MTSIEFLGHIFDVSGVRLSDARVKGIQELPEPTSVKGVRSFIGMVNYFRDFIKGLSSYMIPLTALTKKISASEPFRMTQEGRAAFVLIKDLLSKSSQLVIMNEQDPLILYTDASTRAIGGVLMQIQDGMEKPVIFVSHVLSDQATRWGIMELELYAFVYCVKILAPYLLGKLFTVRTDHRNFVYLASSSVPKLVRWRVILSEYRFLIEHIPGAQNVVADGLTRVCRSDFMKIAKDKRHIDSTERIFRLGEEGLEQTEFPGELEEEDQVGAKEDFDDYGIVERHEVFSRYHNSIVGHHGVERTLKAMSLGGHAWAGMRQNVSNWIGECSICQKIKFQRLPEWEDEVEHHLYSLSPLTSLSVDTLGPLKEDENGNSFVIVIVDNFSKLIGLYPAKSTTSKEFISALLQWVSIFGVPKEIRSDGGSQFTSKMAADIRSLLHYDHLVVVAYHPEANGIVERRIKEVMKHLRALVYEKRIRDSWSHYLPLVQRIINYTVDGSIGTQPARVIFGDLETSDIAMDVPSDWGGKKVEDYLVRLREAQVTLIKATQEFLKKNQRKRAADGRVKSKKVTIFEVGQFVLLQYPSRPPDKLSGLYRGPLEIVAIDRPDIIKVKDLTTNKISSVHTSRLRIFRHPTEMTREEIEVLASIWMNIMWTRL